MTATLTAVIHGYSGMGKSWAGDTAPAPRLILDAEGGSRFTPSGPKIYWDPAREEPPVPGAGRLTPGGELVSVDWVTCIVFTRDFATVSLVYQWLNSGQHHFASVVMDSLTEIQKRCLDQVVGVNAPQTQDWGTLLRYMEGLVRNYRDLTFHPIKPLQAVIFLALTSEHGEGGQLRPHVQGQLGTTLPGFVDLVGYLSTEQDGEGQLFRRLLVQPYGRFVAKDRTNCFGVTVDGPDLNLASMLARLEARATA